MSNGAWNVAANGEAFFYSQIKSVAEKRGVQIQLLGARPPAGIAAAQVHTFKAAPGSAVLLVDLRRPERWDVLAEVVQQWRRTRGDRPYIVGLIEGGVPVERWLEAESLLNDTICYAASVDEIDAVFARAAIGATAPRTMAELRELAGGGERLVTRTSYMHSLFENAELIAKRDLAVLLVGETGTGKATLARIIHGLSARRGKSFTHVACGTLQTELIDSALFGHVRGAFAGADSDKEGKFAAARDGTLLLDEIDILGPHQQARLLRVLETGQYEALGSNDTLATNARVIVATNEPLKPLVDRGRFRPDLYFRLNQVMLELPPLRKRPLDIVPMALQFVEQTAQRNQVEIRLIHPGFLHALEEYSWPGNVRELRNEVTRAVLFARNGVIDPRTLSATIKNERKPQPSGSSPSGLAGEVACTEQAAIERMLRAHRFNRTATAKALGISRVTLYNKIRRYRIEVDALRTKGAEPDPI